MRKAKLDNDVYYFGWFEYNISARSGHVINTNMKYRSTDVNINAPDVNLHP